MCPCIPAFNDNITGRSQKQHMLSVIRGNNHQAMLCVEDQAFLNTEAWGAASTTKIRQKVKAICEKREATDQRQHKPKSGNDLSTSRKAIGLCHLFSFLTNGCRGSGRSISVWASVTGLGLRTVNYAGFYVFFIDFIHLALTSYTDDRAANKDGRNPSRVLRTKT